VTERASEAVSEQALAQASDTCLPLRRRCCR
jgi:hypothetical protein